MLQPLTPNLFCSLYQESQRNTGSTMKTKATVNHSADDRMIFCLPDIQYHLAIANDYKANIQLTEPYFKKGKAKLPFTIIYEFLLQFYLLLGILPSSTFWGRISQKTTLQIENILKISQIYFVHFLGEKIQVVLIGGHLVLVRLLLAGGPWVSARPTSSATLDPPIPVRTGSWCHKHTTPPRRLFCEGKSQYPSDLCF